MAWIRNTKGLVFKPNVFPLVEIPDHLWIQLSIDVRDNPKRARNIIYDFCEIFDLPLEVVVYHLNAEFEAIEERPSAVLH
jgi:hypothetical protein